MKTKEISKALAYLMVFLGIQMLTGGLINCLCGIWKEESIETNSWLLIGTTIVANAVAILIFLLSRWTIVSPNWIRTRPWGILFWCVVASFGAIIPSVWSQEQLPSLPNLMEAEFDIIMGGRAGYFAVGLLAPLAEEIVFRGAILRVLLHRNSGIGKWWAIFISALLFALAHFNPAQMPHAFIIGLLLGWMYMRTGSILPGVAFHWVNNTISYVLYKFYPDPDITLIDIFGSSQNVAMAVGFSLLILLPALFQLNLRMDTEQK